MSALDGGEDGLVFYRRITELAKVMLNSQGCLFFEVGHDQSEDVKNIMINNGFSFVTFEKDLAGINRVVWGKMQQNVHTAQGKENA